MKAIMRIGQIICFNLVMSAVFNVNAVTDTELKEIEKQIKLQEAEKKLREEEEAKQKADMKRKAEAEARRKEEAEARRIAEEKRRADAEQKREQEARDMELERLRQEKETRRKAEEEKQKKYDVLIKEAEDALERHDKELAISKFKDALNVYPDDKIAISGLKQAQQLIDKRCLDAVVGVWEPKYLLAGRMVIKPDGTAKRWVREPELVTQWKCIDPGLPVIKMEDKYAISELKPLSNGCLEDKSDYNKDGVWSTPYTCWLKKE